jgi:plasmid stability protein
MKNITFNADEALIEAARQRAAREQRSLNEVFREWLGHYARPVDTRELSIFLADLRSKVDTQGQRFSREEMNAR